MEHKSTSDGTPSETRPVPAPPPVEAYAGESDDVIQVTERLQEAGEAPLGERAAALAAIHETLALELRQAEG